MDRQGNESDHYDTIVHRNDIVEFIKGDVFEGEQYKVFKQKGSRVYLSDGHHWTHIERLKVIPKFSEEQEWKQNEPPLP